MVNIFKISILILSVLLSVTGYSAGFQYGGIRFDEAATATAAATTTLTNSSKQIQVFTGSTTQNLVLPAATTLSLGYWYMVVNESSGAITVKDGGGSTLITLVGASAAAPNAVILVARAIGSSAGTWSLLPAVTNLSYLSGVATIAQGGTNSGTSLNNNRIMKSSGGAIVEAAAITANRALASDSNGIPVATSTTDTELGYVHSVTSAIQTQLDAKQPLDGDLTALAALSGTNNIYYRSASNTWTSVTIGTGLDFTAGTLSAVGGSASGTIIEVGNAKYAATASCQWNSTSTSMSSFSADSDCPTPSVTGGVTAPATKIPGVTFTVSDANDVYYFSAKGYFGKDSSANFWCAWRFSDGTDSSSIMVNRSEVAATLVVPVLAGRIKFGSTGAKTVGIQVLSSTGSSCDIDAGTAVNVDLEISVWKADD